MYFYCGLKWVFNLVYIYINWFGLCVVIKCFNVVFMFNVRLFVVVYRYFSWRVIICIYLVNIGLKLVDDVVCVLDIFIKYIGS